MKLKRVVVLVVLVIVAIVIGFFVYKKFTEENVRYVEVKFIDDYNHETLSTQTLEVGNDAEVPDEPKHEGCKFSGWYDSSNEKITSFKNIQNDLIAYAKCADIYYKVKFVDSISKRVIDTQKVKYGNDAVAPVAPKHYGYNFIRWKGNYSNVTSNLVVNAMYGLQSAKYIVKYYTVNEDNVETLYTTKTFNSYVNRKVTASIISIGGYQYDKNNSHNKISGRVSADNSLVLKVYYDTKTYTIVINGEETTYNYDEEIALPELEKTVRITYQENDNVDESEKLNYNDVDLKHIGYCKNSKTCTNVISPNTVINVKESAEYYPVWEMEMELNLPAGNGYTLDDEEYEFAKWIGPDDVYYFEGDKIRFTDDITLIALYRKANQSTTVEGTYTVNTYRDGELYSSITEHGEIGSEVLGSLYAKTVKGYELESYTNSIFIQENSEDNLIEVFYVTGENEDAPIITRKVEGLDTLSLDDDLENKQDDEKALLDNSDDDKDKEIIDDLDKDKELPDNFDNELDKDDYSDDSIDDLDKDKELADNPDDEKEELDKDDDDSMDNLDKELVDNLDDEEDELDKEKDKDKELIENPDKESFDNPDDKKDDDKKVPEEKDDDVKPPLVKSTAESESKEKNESVDDDSKDKDLTPPKKETEIESPPKVDSSPEKDNPPSKVVEETITKTQEEEM